MSITLLSLIFYMMNNKTTQNVVHPAHYLPELPHEDDERLGKLFNNLDIDGNGKIDIHDLSVALKQYGVSHRYVQVCFKFFLTKKKICIIKFINKLMNSMYRNF